jgi:hypothetical protein
MQAYYKVTCDPNCHIEGLDVVYETALNAIKDLPNSKNDVLRLSMELMTPRVEQWFEKRAGLLLSALINMGDDDEYTILVGRESPLSFLGAWNESKTIDIFGDVGNGLGTYMSGGLIRLFGNSQDFTGSHMSGGSIEVDKNTDHHTGAYMRGGNIIVGGYSGYLVGDQMKRGSIRLNNSFLSMSQDIQGGKIYHKGKLIVNK